MGLAAGRYAVATASSARPLSSMVFSMADPQDMAPPGSQVLMTQADFDLLVDELEALRSKHRGEVAGRLREARAFGAST